MQGFTLLEILLVISLTSLLCLSCFGFFLEMLQLYHGLLQNSETMTHLRTGMESMWQDLQEADPSTIQLQSPVVGGYSQIQFSKYSSADLHLFYVNSSKKLIKGVQHPGNSWGYITIADEIEELVFTPPGWSSISTGWLRVKLVSHGGRSSLVSVFSAGI